MAMLNNQMVTIQYEDSFSPVDVWADGVWCFEVANDPVQAAGLNLWSVGGSTHHPR